MIFRLEKHMSKSSRSITFSNTKFKLNTTRMPRGHRIPRTIDISRGGSRRRAAEWSVARTSTAVLVVSSNFVSRFHHVKTCSKFTVKFDSPELRRTSTRFLPRSVFDSPLSNLTVADVTSDQSVKSSTVRLSKTLLKKNHL